MAVMMRKLPAFAIFLLVVLSAPALQAQSYDCRRAMTPDEIAVCRDPLLGELDVIQATFYKRLRHYTQNFDNAMGLQGQLVGEARAFLHRRAACGADTACLESVYRARIRELLEHWMRAMDGNIREGRATGETNPPMSFSCKVLNLTERPEIRRNCPEVAEHVDMLKTWPLDGKTVVCAVPCFVGAYNIIYRAYLVNATTGDMMRDVRFPMLDAKGRMMRQNEIVSPVFDANGRILSSFNRGRGLGDCGEQYRWHWNGKNFQLVEQRMKDACDGKSGSWRKVWPR